MPAFRYLLTILTCLVIAGCASAPPSPTPTHPPAATATKIPPTFTVTVVPITAAPPTDTPTTLPTFTPTRAATRTPRPPTATAVTACPGAPPLTLSIGKTVMVGLEPPIPSRVREQPSRSATFLGEIQPGELVKVTDGPECGDGYTWWKIQSDTGLIGWTIEGDSAGYWLLIPTPMPTRTPAPRVTNTPAPVSAVDGSGQIAFVTSNAGSSQIHLVNSDGNGLVNLSNSPATKDFLPTWSPDGGRLAFVRQANTASGLWVMNPDGSGQIQLFTNEAIIEKIVWSPDGGRLAFCTYAIRNNKLDSGVYVINADGSGLVQVDASRLSFGFGNVDWAPDGSRVFFVAMYGNPDNQASYYDETIDIYGVAPDGSSRTNLTSSLAPDFSPSVSPDGTRLVFARKDVAWVVPVTGGGQTPITVPDKHGIVQSGPFIWVDNSQIIFPSTSGKILMQVDGPTYTTLSWLSDATGFSLARDNSRLVYVTRDGKLYTMLMTDLLNRGPGPKLIAEQALSPAWRP